MAAYEQSETVCGSVVTSCYSLQFLSLQLEKRSKRILSDQEIALSLITPAFPLGQSDRTRPCLYCCEDNSLPKALSKDSPSHEPNILSAPSRQVQALARIGWIPILSCKEVLAVGNTDRLKKWTLETQHSSSLEEMDMEALHTSIEEKAPCLSDLLDIVMQSKHARQNKSPGGSHAEPICSALCTISSRSIGLHRYLPGSVFGYIRKVSNDHPGHLP